MNVEHVMSVDVEEWYHGEFTKDSEIKCLKYDVTKSVTDIVNMFDSHGIHATFFVVGELIEKHAGMIPVIMNSGHEIGFHGWNHRPLWRLDQNVFRHHLEAFSAILREHGYRPVSFRAPSCSLDRGTSWAVLELARAGYKIDSSVFPAMTPLYGVPDAPIEPYWLSHVDVGRPFTKELSDGIVEYPFLALGPKGFRLPLGTGFYLRALPYSTYSSVLRKRKKQRIPAVISFHSWEFSEHVPPVYPSWISRIYLSYRLRACSSVVERLLGEAAFTSLKESSIVHFALD